MKKVISVLLAVSISFMSFTSIVHATGTSENLILVYEGTTEDGIEYQVYKPVESSRAVISRNVTRIIQFRPVGVTPPNTVYYEEKLDSYTTLSGTLTLFGPVTKDYEKNLVEVVYKGTLSGRI